MARAITTTTPPASGAAPPPSPLVRWWAGAVVQFVADRGGKVYFTPEVYDRLAEDGFEPHAVDGALESLWAAGLIDLRVAGEIPVAVLRGPPGPDRLRVPSRVVEPAGSEGEGKKKGRRRGK